MKLMEERRGVDVGGLQRKSKAEKSRGTPTLFLSNVVLETSMVKNRPLQQKGIMISLRRNSLEKIYLRFV